MIIYIIKSRRTLEEDDVYTGMLNIDEDTDESWEESEWAVSRPEEAQEEVKGKKDEGWSGSLTEVRIPDRLTAEDAACIFNHTEYQISNQILETWEQA